MARRYGPHGDKPRPTAYAQWQYTLRCKAGLGCKNLAVLIEQKFGFPCDGGRISEWETGRGIPRPHYVIAVKALIAPNGPEPPAPTKVA